MKKILLIILSLLCIISLVSCGNGKPEDSRVVMKVGEKNIVFDYYRYVFLNTRDDMDNGKHDIWIDNDDLQADLYESVVGSIVHNRAIELVAGKYYVALSADDKKATSEWIAEQKNALGDDWERSLSDAYLTEYTLAYLNDFNILWRKIYNYYTDEANGIVKCGDDILVGLVPELFHNIYFVMVSSERENASEIADEVKSLADSGEDFKSLIEKYADNDYADYIDDGYYYIDDEIIPEIADAVEKMNTGEISSVIATDTGFFVVKKLEMETNYIEANLNEFRKKYLAYCFNKEVTETEKNITVSYSDLYSELTVLNIK